MVLVRIYLSCCNIPDNMGHLHCVKSVQLQSFFWSVFSCIRTKFLKSPYSVRILKNMDQKKFRIWTFFAHCYSSSFFFFFVFLRCFMTVKDFQRFLIEEQNVSILSRHCFILISHRGNRCDYSLEIQTFSFLNQDLTFFYDLF